MVATAERPTAVQRLDCQPGRQEVLTLPFFHIVPERRDIFNFSQSDVKTMSLQLTQLRDRRTDNDTFRNRIGSLTQYLLRTMGATSMNGTEVETPLGVKARGLKLDLPPVAIFYINRAGLTMGLEAARWLPSGTPIGELDISRDEETLEGIIKGYNLPEDISGRNVILLDVMNATGGTLTTAWETVKSVYGKRQQKARDVYVLNIIAAPLGVQVVREAIPDAQILTMALDDRLTTPWDTNSRPGYIVPGLGDAGDRQFGSGRSSIFYQLRQEISTFIKYEDSNRIRM